MAQDRDETPAATAADLPRQVYRVAALTGRKRSHVIFAPDATARKQIAAALGLIGLPALRLEGDFTPEGRHDLRFEGVLVAKQLSGGTECIMGIARDPVFGPVAMFGLGGIFVEILKDVVFHRCPFGEDVAERMIRSIKGAPLLLGARGRKPADIAALSKMLATLSVFAHQAGPRLQSIDLNPVFAMPDGEGAFAADAIIEIGDA